MEAVLEQGLEPVEQPAGGEGGGQQQQTPDPKVFDREYSTWIKGLREDGDAAKFHRRAKDDFGRLQALSRIDPKGIDGVRERYAAVDGLAYGDKKGLDAVTSMQSALAESQSALDAIAQGDLTSLNDDQRMGLLRMTPQILDTLAENDAEGYAAAVLPHFVEALKGSELVTAFNGLVDALKEAPPSWLTKEQVPQWTNERLQRVLTHAAAMGKWFQTQDERVQQMGKGDGAPKPRMDGKPAGEQDTGAAANPQFWETSVYPDTNAHAEQTFDRELRPWAEKLAKAGFRLSEAKKTALAQEFVRGVIVEALKNDEYRNQMGRYNRQRTPDKASVVSTFKAEFNRHAPNVLKALITRDYGQILDKRTAPKPAPAAPNGKGAPPAPQKGVKIVSVMPQRSQIDFPRTPADWIYKNQYRLRSGEVVQYRP